MDPNHQPSGPQSDLRHEPAGIPSRSSSRRDPATPDEVGQQADGYFEPLSTTASRRSRLSTLSINRRASRSLASESAASGAERSRRPSIRIRRSSVGLPNSQTYPQRSESYQLDQRDHGTDSAPRGNRPRSTSQPGPAPGGNNAGGFARNSRRQPQIALPRLTEEGSRPTMAELGMAGTSPISPSISAPMSGLQRSHSDTEMEIAGPGEQEGKPAKGRLSRMIWPSFRRASVGQAPAEQLSPEEEEYNEELVDWLDIVGALPATNSLVDLTIWFELTITRSRSSNALNTYERSKLTLYSRFRTMGQSTADVCSVTARFAAAQAGLAKGVPTACRCPRTTRGGEAARGGGSRRAN